MNYHPDLMPTALRMLTSLGVILVILLFALYFARRIFKKQVVGSKDGLIRVVANTYIGIKKNISMIEVPGAVLILGVTSDNISLLAKIEKQEILDKFKEVSEKKVDHAFSGQLRKITLGLKKARNDVS